jgi:beta-phosphoglucomutase-like phosphatase (HAD superfamily)
MLANLSLNEYLDTYVTNQDVSKGKPAPDTFLKAAEKLSLLPSRCAVVEDAVQGVEAGKAAGMPVVAVTTTRARQDLEQADLVVDSLAELNADDFTKLLTRPGT